MVACELCTGHHSTNTCASGLVFVEQCFRGTPDDFTPEHQSAPEGMILMDGSNVIPLFVDPRNRTRGEERRAIAHWGLRIATNEGIRATKLA